MQPADPSIMQFVNQKLTDLVDSCNARQTPAVFILHRFPKGLPAAQGFQRIYKFLISLRYVKKSVKRPYDRVYTYTYTYLPKRKQNRSCYSYVRFEPKIIFVFFEDTLVPWAGPSAINLLEAWGGGCGGWGVGGGINRWDRFEYLTRIILHI